MGGYQLNNLMADGSTTTTAGGGGGDVSSSISVSVNGAVPIFDLTTGKVIKSSGVICDASNNLSGINSITSTLNPQVVGVNTLSLLLSPNNVNNTVMDPATSSNNILIGKNR